MNVAEALAIVLVEAVDPVWQERTRKLAPLVRRLTKIAARRFRKQRDYFLDECLPLIEDTFTEAKKKPPKRAERAFEQLDRFTDPQFDDLVNSILQRAVILGAKEAAKDVASEIVWDRRTETVAEYLKTRSGRLIAKDVDETTRNLVSEVLAKGYEEKWTFHQMKKGVRELWDGFTRQRAELIAVTETGNAWTHGTLEFARSLNTRMEKSWSAEPDACPICAGNAAQGWIPLEDLFSGGVEGPCQHPACKCSLLTRLAGRGT